MRRRRKVYDDGDEIVEDGGHVRVPLFLTDGCLHRPGPCMDALGFTHDADDLRDAQREREKAFRDLCRRSENAWRMRDARTEQLGAEGGDGDEERGDPDEDSDDDRMAQAVADRERARLERDQRGDAAWRNMGRTMDPTAATEIERARQRIQGGR